MKTYPSFLLLALLGTVVFSFIFVDVAASQNRRPLRQPVRVNPVVSEATAKETVPVVSKGVLDDETESIDLVFDQTPDELVALAFAADADGVVSKGLTDFVNVDKVKKVATGAISAEVKKQADNAKKQLEKTIQSAIDRGKNEAEKAYQSAIKTAESKMNAKKKEVDAWYATASQKAKAEADSASKKAIADIESKAKKAIAELGKTEKDQKKREALEKKLKADLERQKKSAESKTKSAIAKVESEAKKKKSAADTEYKKAVSDAKKTADKYKSEVASKAKKEAQSKLDALNKQFGTSLKI